MDVHDKQTRSFNMSRIKGKDTKPEEIVRKYLFKQGFRYRKNDKKLPGKPDIVLPKYKTVIFVNGCFWHKHDGCKKNNELLTKMGWHIIVVWECELKVSVREKTLESLCDKLKNNL